MTAFMYSKILRNTRDDKNICFSLYNIDIFDHLYLNKQWKVN